MNRPKITVIFFLILIAFLYVYHSHLLSYLGEQNAVYSDILMELEDVKKKKELVKEQLLRESSLQTIRRKATEQGYYPTNEVFVLKWKNGMSPTQIT